MIGKKHTQIPKSSMDSPTAQFHLKITCKCLATFNRNPTLLWLHYILLRQPGECNQWAECQQLRPLGALFLWPSLVVSGKKRKPEAKGSTPSLPTVKLHIIFNMFWPKNLKYLYDRFFPTRLYTYTITQSVSFYCHGAKSRAPPPIIIIALQPSSHREGKSQELRILMDWVIHTRLNHVRSSIKLVILVTEPRRRWICSLLNSHCWCLATKITYT